MRAVPDPGPDPLREEHRRLVEAGLLSPGHDARSLSARLAEVPPRAPSAASLERWSRWLDDLQAPEPIRGAFRRLRDGGARVVVTGQQAGVLGGPYLGFLKAAHAIRLAREVQALSGEAVVAVFWVASDDHDLGEVRTTHVVDAARAVRRFSLPLPASRAAVSEVSLAADARPFAQTVLTTADAGGDPPEWMLPEEGERLSRWFTRLLIHCFGEHGLVPVEPRLLLEEGRSIFERILHEPAAWSGPFEAGRAALQAAGTAPPLDTPDGLPLYRIESRDRRRIRQPEAEGSGHDRAVPRDDLTAWLGDGVPRLSPDAALRTVLQDRALPVLAYVAGPTEMRYWAQLGPVHEAFATPFPSVVPRMSVRILPRRIARVLRKRGWSLEQALQGPEGPDPAPTPEALAGGEPLRALLHRWTEDLAALDPAVERATRRRREGLLAGFDLLFRQARSSWESRDRRQLEAREWLEAYLQPRGADAERVLGPMPFYLEQGPALIEALCSLDDRARSWTLLLE